MRVGVHHEVRGGTQRKQPQCFCVDFWNVGLISPILSTMRLQISFKQHFSSDEIMHRVLHCAAVKRT